MALYSEGQSSISSDSYFTISDLGSEDNKPLSTSSSNYMAGNPSKKSYSECHIEGINSQLYMVCNKYVNGKLVSQTREKYKDSKKSKRY